MGENEIPDWLSGIVQEGGFQKPEASVDLSDITTDDAAELNRALQKALDSGRSPADVLGKIQGV